MIFAESRFQTSFCAILALSFLTYSCATSQAGSIAIFHEDFNDFTGFPSGSNDIGGHRTNFGVPTIAEGADNDWIGARFEAFDSNPITSDVGVLKYGNGGPSGPYGNPAARIGDDAGIVAKIDLTLYENVKLSFDWRTFATESTDRLVGSYYVGDGLGNPTASGAIFDWFNDPTLGNGDMSASDPSGQANTWYVNNWTDFHRATSPGGFQQESGISLPGGDILYLAFWLDNGDHDLGKIDNIWIMGDLIPEPSSMALAMLGGILALSRGRRARR